MKQLSLFFLKVIERGLLSANEIVELFWQSDLSSNNHYQTRKKGFENGKFACTIWFALGVNLGNFKGNLTIDKFLHTSLLKGWWISWCPFVGMFIAKISKGRTIRQFINGTLTAPVLYTFFWMVIFGGAGLRLERGAQGNGYCCPDSQGWVQNVTAVETIIKERDLVNQVVAANSSYFLCEGGECGSCAFIVLDRYDESEQTYGRLLSDYQSLARDFGSVSPDRQLARISCHSIEQMWFDLMRSYGDIGGFLSIFSLVGIILYFVTSSDSGSLVIDCLSANGDPDPPRLQRVFWALMEGATATALLVAGGKQGLTALQSAGLLSGLPYIVLVTLICVSIWRTCQVAAGDLDPDGPTFAIGLYDPFACQPYHEIGKNLGATVKLFLGFLMNIIIAPWSVAQAHGRYERI